MDINKIEEYINVALEENPSLFLVDLTMGAENKISVTIDGDEGVPLNECIRVSRFVDNQFDREEEDFSIEVATPDIAKPIQLKRQYIKNIGRLLQVKTADTNYEGTLDSVSENAILLKWKERVPKPIGKGKVTIEQQQEVLLENIIEAKVKIVFN